MIDDCTIDGNFGDAIGIYNSGNVEGNHDISNNTILNNGIAYSGSGITIYHSYANVYGNQLIEGNKYGILCYNNSNISIQGNSDANYVYETQIIRDNYKYQVYASKNSFPYYFKWNAIVDEDNQYPLVYYSTLTAEELDVTNNYWGNNFNPQMDLFPWSYYNYLPIWQLTGTGSGTGAEYLYNSAQSKISTGDYEGAKLDFQQIIIDYPATQYAQAALRELFSMEEYFTNDYNALKTYFATEPEIQNNPDLNKLAEYLSNSCDIKLENWPDAINYYETIILNPESTEDSIFAIIDLGYVYFVMENSNYKSAYTGNLVQYKHKSKEQFFENRDYLLSLIPGDRMSEAMKGKIAGLKAGELLQNVPNPFSGYSQIWYKLENESAVQLSVYNYTGQLIRTINEGKKTKGTHFIDFDAAGLKAGIYFYSISINGQTSDSKKMTIMK